MATVDNRYVTALGPIKMEVMILSALTSADTVTTLLQRPLGCVVTTDNTGGATAAPKAVITANSKTITITQTSLSAGSGVLITFGF